MEKWNSQLEHDSQWNKQKACFASVTQVWLAVNTTPASLLANQFDV